MYRILLLPAALCAMLLSPAPAAAQPDSRFEQALATLRPKLVTDPDAVLAATPQLAHLVRRGDAGQQAALLWLRAEAEARTGDPVAARVLVDRGLALVDGGSSAIRGDLLRTRGDLATDRSDVAAALADYQAAYQAYLAAGNMRGCALALTSIASLYREGGDYESALRYLGQAIDIGGDPTMMASIYNNRGNVLAETRRDKQAVRDFRRALVLIGDTNPALAARVWGNLARSQVAVGDTRAAWSSVSRGIAIARRQGSRQALDGLRSISARIAMERGDRARALRLIDGIFAGVDLTATTLAERDNHRNAYAVYAAAGQTTKALAHLEALNRLDDQATQVATSAKTALMSARFDFQNQELRIAGLKQAELRRNVAFERSRARFERILFMVGAGAVGIVIIVLGVVVLTLRRSRDEVRAANAGLETTNAALGRALEAKTEFLATTSHEIRTPLNGILGMTQVMLADPALPPVTRDRLGVVQGAGLAMRALVDDILDLAKMTAGKLSVTLEPTDPAAVLHEVAAMWRTQAQERGLAFAVAIDPLPAWIESDPGRLRQIVNNLLSNAIKFTAQGSIALTAQAAGERLRITVRDSGIGIAPERQREVFESFRQADASTTRRYGGTGLGLTISRNLAQALGGDILLDSVEGEGATFTVDLPLVPVAAPAGAVAERSGEELVVVEANPIVRGKLRGLLAPHVAGIAFAGRVDDLIAGLAGGRHGRALIDLTGLRAMSDDIDRDLARIAAALAARGARGIVLLAQDEAHVAVPSPLTPLHKPVSGTKLRAELFASSEGAEAVHAPLFPMRTGAIAGSNMPDIFDKGPATLRCTS
ncbi:ATP-binding protein [Sphingomonas silueang]|uniref:ATP-binding protein n=1 Tax=Sphingomonas silueang TaxID=3156617 RepID=UPI0032B618E8